MSAIDQYKHKHIGFIECPSSYNIVYANDDTRLIAIYELLQDIPDDETDFDGKTGDILLGGGSGEAAAMRISTDRAFRSLSDYNFYPNDDGIDIYKSFWSATQAYKFCQGFKKLGWKPREEIEDWLLKNLIIILSNNSLKYSRYKIKTRYKPKIKFELLNIDE